MDICNLIPSQLVKDFLSLSHVLSTRIYNLLDEDALWFGFNDRSTHEEGDLLLGDGEIFSFDPTTFDRTFEQPEGLLINSFIQIVELMNDLGITRLRGFILFLQYSNHLSGMDDKKIERLITERYMPDFHACEESVSNVIGTFRPRLHLYSLTMMSSPPAFITQSIDTIHYDIMKLLDDKNKIIDSDLNNDDKNACSDFIDHFIALCFLGILFRQNQGIDFQVYIKEDPSLKRFKGSTNKQYKLGRLLKLKSTLQL